MNKHASQQTSRNNSSKMVYDNKAYEPTLDSNFLFSSLAEYCPPCAVCVVEKRFLD